MLKVSEVRDYLATQFPGIKFYNGAINKNDTMCVGLYAKGAMPPNIAIGGASQTSYGTLSIHMLVHWTEDSELCETTANSIYTHLFGKSNFTIGGKRIATVRLLDPHPTDLARDSKNICEMLIRAVFIYDKEVT